MVSVDRPCLRTISRAQSSSWLRRASGDNLRRRGSGIRIDGLGVKNASSLYRASALKRIDCQRDPGASKNAASLSRRATAIAHSDRHPPLLRSSANYLQPPHHLSCVLIERGSSVRPITARGKGILWLPPPPLQSDSNEGQRRPRENPRCPSFAFDEVSWCGSAPGH